MNCVLYWPIRSDCTSRMVSGYFCQAAIRNGIAYQAGGVERASKKGMWRAEGESEAVLLGSMNPYP